MRFYYNIEEDNLLFYNRGRGVAKVPAHALMPFLAFPPDEKDVVFRGVRVSQHRFHQNGIKDKLIPEQELNFPGLVIFEFVV